VSSLPDESYKLDAGTNLEMPSQRATIKHVVLGLVLERPSYGYELGNRLGRRFPHWSPTGVYDALDRLEREELVVASDGRAAGSARGVPKTIYTGTTAGQAFLRDWLLQPTEFIAPRQDLDVKIDLSGPEEWPSLIVQISGQEVFCLNAVKKLADSCGHPVGSRLDWPEASAVLQRNAEIKMLEVRIEWLQDVRKTLCALLERRPKAV
jgi:DNA-binding PadR family transcriptional regulator